MGGDAEYFAEGFPAIRTGVPSQIGHGEGALLKILPGNRLWIWAKLLALAGDVDISVVQLIFYRRDTTLKDARFYFLIEF